jgi:hypothetical protein
MAMPTTATVPAATAIQRGPVLDVYTSEMTIATQ